MKRKLLLILSATMFIVGVTGVVIWKKTPPAVASFNANNVIDDYTFDNTGSMSADQINSFLNGFPNSCISPNSGFDAIEPTGYSPSGGFTYGGYVSAGQVIKSSAQVYGINPQVLLVTLQKEQSLVAGGAGYCNNGEEHKYAAAVGYGCPDGGTVYNYSGLSLYRRNGVVHSSTGNTCVNSSSKAGFSQQVIRAAWLLKFGEQRSEGNVGWAVIGGSWNNSDDPPTCYAGPMTQGYRQRCQGGSNVYYDGYLVIDGSSTHMDNGATAALYWYTPHFHGNQNFVSIFESWFGSTNGQGYSWVISDDSSDPRQWVVYGNIKQYIPDSQTIHAWGLDNTTITTMSATQLASIPTGPSLARLFRVNGGPDFFFVDSGKKYKLNTLAMLDEWNIRGMTISSVTEGLGRLPVDGGWMGAAVQRTGGGSIYMLDGGGSQTLLRPYASNTVLDSIEGEGTVPMTISDDLYSSLNPTIGSAITSSAMSYNGINFEAMSGWRYNVPSNMSGLFSGSPQSVSAGTYNRFNVGDKISPIIQQFGDPSVYLVDNGVKHHILYPDQLNAWAPAGLPIFNVTASFSSSLSTAGDVSGYVADVGGQLYVVDHGTRTVVPSTLSGAYGNMGVPFTVGRNFIDLFPQQPSPATSLMQGVGDPAVYLLDNNGQKHYIDTLDKLALWGGYQTGITYLSRYVINSTVTGSGLQVFVSDGTTNYVMEGGKKWTVSSSVKADWGLSTPQVFSDGTLSSFTTGGALTNSVQDGKGIYAVIRSGVCHGTVDASIASSWGVTNASVHDIALIRSLISNNGMLTRYVRSNVGGDNRIFLIDNGQWYNLPPAYAANLNAYNQPAMWLNPDQAPNTITDWTSVMVKDAQSNYFVIDGGIKRWAPNNTIITQWNHNGSIDIPTVTSGFMAGMPTGPQIERSIKGSSPSVYFVENNTKRHILYPDNLKNYVPFATVSEQLLNALPDGTPI